MCAGGKPFADKGEDACLDAGKFMRNFNIVYTTEGSAGLGGLVFPSDSEEVGVIQIPQSNMGKLCLDILRYGRGVHHLLECREHNALFLAAFDVLCPYFIIDIQIDQHVLSSVVTLCCFFRLIKYTAKK